MSERKGKIPFRVKMANGSIQTIYAYSEKQALYLASKSGKRAIEVVGILMEKQIETDETPKRMHDESIEIIEKLHEALENKKFFEAMEYKIQIWKMIIEGKINWSNKLERKYELFGKWWNK